MSLGEKLQKILKEEPALAIVLAEILSPPPGISSAPRPWEG